MNEAAVEFREHDRVELLVDLGPLKAGTSGIVVEVYEGEGLPEDAEYLRESEWPTDSEFAVAVAFPALRLVLPPEGLGWVCDDLDVSSLHAGDVVPIRASEVKVTGNIMDEGYDDVA